MLQRVAVCCRALKEMEESIEEDSFAAVCCSVLHVLQRTEACCSALQSSQRDGREHRRGLFCCSVLLCVACVAVCGMCCSVLTRVVVHCRALGKIKRSIE